MILNFAESKQQFWTNIAVLIPQFFIFVTYFKHCQYGTPY